jgi:alpha-1,3-mannosyltransferase
MARESIIAFEAVLCGLIIAFVPYTEIDWATYMQQVDVYLEGQYDYYQIGGDTGPLVYPAGHLYLFSLLKLLTSGDIFIGQLIFAALYLLTLNLVFKNYEHVRLPSWVFVACCLSRRLHSIYVLRLFNDCFCVLFCHLSFYLILQRRWKLALVTFSLAVSVKMSALLFAPGILFLLVSNFGLTQALVKICIYCGLPQLILGAQFLLANPVAYLHRSFELSRVFVQHWSVNLKFLPEDVFLSGRFALVLLLLTIGIWFWFYLRIWRRLKLGDPENVLFVLFSSQFVGVVFSRTLHYQFYAWYFWTLPALVHWARLPWLVLLPIELAFNVFPSTWWSSALLQVSHLTLLLCLGYRSLGFRV